MFEDRTVVLSCWGAGDVLINRCAVPMRCRDIRCRSSSTKQIVFDRWPGRQSCSTEGWQMVIEPPCASYISDRYFSFRSVRKVLITVSYLTSLTQDSALHYGRLFPKLRLAGLKVRPDYQRDGGVEELTIMVMLLQSRDLVGPVSRRSVKSSGVCWGGRELRVRNWRLLPIVKELRGSCPHCRLPRSDMVVGGCGGFGSAIHFSCTHFEISSGFWKIVGRGWL